MIEVLYAVSVLNSVRQLSEKNAVIDFSSIICYASAENRK